MSTRFVDSGDGYDDIADLEVTGAVRRDVCEWLEFHGIDPALVPCESTIERDERGRCIRYETAGHPVITGDDGEVLIIPAIEQGEAPPLPFPPSVQARMVRR